MNNVRKLMDDWDANASGEPKDKALSIKLNAYDYARIRALAEIYNGKTENQIVSDLVSTALDEVEEAMPYIQGSKVIAEDEFGDPVYEDVGMTPRFEALIHKYSAGSKS